MMLAKIPKENWFKSNLGFLLKVNAYFKGLE